LAAEDVCSECGERNPPNSAFCVFCGAYLGWDETDPSDQVTTRIAAPPANESARQSSAAHSGTTSVPEHETSRIEAVPADHQPVAPTAQPTTDVAVCPACGTPTEASRRFCGKCGQPLRAANLRAPQELPGTQMPSLWQRISDPASRASRRAYRRSLPWWRRWRRVAFGAIALLLVGGGVFALQHDAVDRVKDLLNGSTTPTKTVPVTRTPTTSNTPPQLLRPYPGHKLSTAIRGRFKSDVTHVQQRLKNLGYTLAVDGDFGPQTKGVVEKFQGDHHLKKDGIVDRATWTKLFARP
jgi:hypothetical protein